MNEAIDEVLKRYPAFQLIESQVEDLYDELVYLGVEQTTIQEIVDTYEVVYYEI